MTNSLTTLPGFFHRAWDALEAGARDAAAPARRVTLATVAIDGGAAARTVVLRGADRASGLLEIHTDLASAKVAELRRDPVATVLAWIAPDRLQLRARIAVAVREGPALDATWADVPETSRISYGGRPEPGRPLTRPEAYRETVERARFGVLSGRVTSLDLVHLGFDLHRRARFDAEDGFAGRWVGP